MTKRSMSKAEVDAFIRGYYAELTKETPTAARQRAFNKRGQRGVFDSYVEIRTPEECWPWLGGTDADGYGRMVEWFGGGSVVAAHVYAAEIAFGARPVGYVVRHLCHNRACCNPRHLAYGTQAENVEDMIRAGRAAWQRPKREKPEK